MSISPFPKLKKHKPRAASFSDVTLRDFSGGLKVTENELALKNKFATTLINCLPGSDTSMEVRFGTKEFATCSANIINQIYFEQHIIAVLSSGEIQKIDDSGTVTTIWNSTIATALPGSPSAWSSGLVQADFSEFRGDLVIVNGVDKPLLLDNALSISYLQDLATGSNVHTPISNFVTTVSNYVVMAGIAAAKTTVYISSTGTSGTWPGDTAPNDGISFDVGAYTGKSSSEIHAIATFKTFLVVYFNDFAVLLALGNFNSGGAHVPEVVDTYTDLGTINHKTTLATDTDLVFPANGGIYSAEKNVFGGTLSTANLSDALGTDYPKITGLVAKNNLDCHVINDPLSHTVFFFFHKADTTISVLAMRYKEDFSKQAWAYVEGWSFTSSCVSEKKRIFFGEGTKIYQYGNNVFSGENYAADYIVGSAEGIDIAFDWEFPWLDAGNRIKTKTLKKLTFDTTGTSDFLLQCFVNKYYKDNEEAYDPAASMEFVAGDAGGYGNNEEGYGGDGFGGGRRANDERFFGFPIKFKILKLRISGATKRPLRMVSLSLIYLKGNYHS